MDSDQLVEKTVPSIKPAQQHPPGRVKRTIRRLLISAICLFFAGWGFQSYRHHLQGQRKKIDVEQSKQKAYNAAIAKPHALGQTAKLGRYTAVLSDVAFRSDLDHPELHKYLIGTWQLNNPKDKTEKYTVICKTVDIDSNAYIVAVLQNVDLSSDEAVQGLVNNAAANTDALPGEIPAHQSTTFTLVSDVGGSGGPYRVICQAAAVDNAVTAWLAQAST